MWLKLLGAMISVEIRLAMPAIGRTSKSGPETEKVLSPKQFVHAVAETLKPLADPKVSVWMRAYMRDQFEFLGIKTPVRRAATAPLIRAQKAAEGDGLLRCARALWALPEREYQFVAVDLLGTHVRKLGPKHIPAIFALVQKKSWWDTVDSLAMVIGSIVRNARADDAEIQRLMDQALESPHLWVRRVAILHQLGWRGNTDSERLFRYALTRAEEKEFFIRKAIGWALRDYARHAPQEVRSFLRTNRGKLSPLTLREAGKHL